MQTIRGVYDGHAIKPTEEFAARPNTRVLITFLEQETERPGFPPTTLEDVAGCLRRTGPAKTLEDMETAIERGIKERWR